MFSRTNVRKVAEKRKQPIDEYCRVSSEWLCYEYHYTMRYNNLLCFHSNWFACLPKSQMIRLYWTSLKSPRTTWAQSSKLALGCCHWLCDIVTACLMLSLAVWHSKLAVWHSLECTFIYTYMHIQWNPYNADTLWNKRSVRIIGVSAFQRYGLNAHMSKQSCSMSAKYQNKTSL